MVFLVDTISSHGKQMILDTFSQTLSRPRHRVALTLAAGITATLLELISAGCGGGGGGASSATDRSVNISFAAQDLRGTVPVTVQIGTGLPSTHTVDAGGVVLNVGAAASSIATVPAVYGDRAFVKWQKDGQDLGATPSLNFTPGSLASGGAVTALYAARSADASGAGFVPNFWQNFFPHWNHFPLRVALDSTTIPDASPTAAAIVAGLDRWVQASGGTVSYQLTRDSTQADIQIAMGTPPSGAAGVCISKWDTNSTLINSTITLEMPTRTDTQGRPMGLDTYAAHEFGHALGMIGTAAGAGHSSDSNDTMYATGNILNPMITARDIDTLASIYPDLFSGSTGRKATPSASATAGPAVHQGTAF